MKRKIDIRTFSSLAQRSLRMALQMRLCIALAALSITSLATRAQAPAHFIGAVTSISGTTLTVKTDNGQSYQVEVPAAAAIKRIAPGEKDLSTAETIQFSNLAIGDRTLVKLDPAAPAGTLQAIQVIAIKQADVQQKQQKDREDWQRNGAGGLVKSVDPASGVIILTSGSGATAKTLTVSTTKTTMLKRYAPASVSFDAAQPAAIDAIHPGDQLRARGTKNADGTTIAAVEVVSGTFRNISGTVISTDPAGSNLVVKDLATKKPVTIHITPDVQMRKLPERMAAMLAARLKGGSGAGQSGAGQTGAAQSGAGQSGGGRPQGAGVPGSAPHPGAGGGQSSGQAGAQAGNGQPGMGQPGSGLAAGDPQQMLNRAPIIQLSDLRKGDAVMIVATDGTTDVTAITLVAGVEPLLEAPEASQSLLNNWSMGSGSGAADAAAQ